MGASVLGWAGGWFWAKGGWDAVAGFTLAALTIALAAALRLRGRAGSRM
jgi:YNFM family putative membrane transporter